MPGPASHRRTSVAGPLPPADRRVPRQRTGPHHSERHFARETRDHRRPLVPRRLEALAALLLFALALVWAVALSDTIRHFRPPARAGAIAASTASAGLTDAEEDALLARYAPRGLLDANDPSYPASIAWVRERTSLASGVDSMGLTIPARAFPDDVRRGPRDPKDWTVYGHAYPRADGGVELQYWFYFPFNKAALFFDHESDWEHVSVELDAERRPVYFALANHHHISPGTRVAWAKVPKDGDHPWFVIASGTHAAYLTANDAPFWERAVDVPRSADGTPILDARVKVVRPGAPLAEGGSPLVNVGERARPRSDADATFFRSYAGLYGAAMPVFGTAAPYGPPYQRSFCVDAKPGSCE